MTAVNPIVYLVAMANIIGMAHLAFFVTGANIYDILAVRKKAGKGKTRLVTGEEAAATATERTPAVDRPRVSVIVPAHNEQTGIVRTLDSLRGSSYRNAEIIVVDDGSTDRTAAVVRQYAGQPVLKPIESRFSRQGSQLALARHLARKDNPVMPISLVRQDNAGKGAAVNNGMRNHADGELLMTLDADSTIQPQAIATAVSYFADKRVIGVAANVRVMGRGWLGALQRFEHLIGYRSKKFYTVTNSEFIVGGVASTYRRDVLEQVGYYDTDTQTEDIGLSMKLVSRLGNRNKRIIYASDVVAMTEGVQSYKALIKQRYRWKLGSLQNLYKYRDIVGRGSQTHSRMLTMYRLPIALLGELLLILEPLMMTYILYLSLSRGSIGIFVGAWLTVTLYTLWTVWPDEHLDLRQKLRMSAGAMVMYLLFYAMTLVQLLAIFNCLYNWRKIFDLSGQSGSWVSPERTLQPLAAV